MDRATFALIDDGHSELFCRRPARGRSSSSTRWAGCRSPSHRGCTSQARLQASSTTPVAIDHPRALRVADLPLHRHDPFDRLLIVRAQVLDVPVMTADRTFARYDVEVISTD